MRRFVRGTRAEHTARGATRSVNVAAAPAFPLAPSGPNEPPSVLSDTRDLMEAKALLDELK